MFRNIRKGHKTAFYLLPGIAFLWAAFALAAHASGEVTEPAQTDAAAEGTTAVQVFDVSPPVRMLAILPPEEGVPRPLDTDARSRIIASIRGEGAIAADQSLQSIVLTAKVPQVADQAKLVMTLPYRVHPETAIELHGNYPHVIGLSLKVEKGGLYLVDFAVKGAGLGAYTVESGSDKQVFDDPSGHLRHVLFGVRARESGWTSVRMRRSGAGYKLYFAEIIRAE
jgi:hypothetical protein